MGFEVSEPVWRGEEDGWEVSIVRAEDGKVMDSFILSEQFLPPVYNSKGKLLWQLPKDSKPNITSKVLPLVLTEYRRRRKQRKKSKPKTASQPPTSAVAVTKDVSGGTPKHVASTQLEDVPVSQGSADVSPKRALQGKPQEKKPGAVKPDGYAKVTKNTEPKSELPQKAPVAPIKPVEDVSITRLLAAQSNVAQDTQFTGDSTNFVAPAETSATTKLTMEGLKEENKDLKVQRYKLQSAVTKLKVENAELKAELEAVRVKLEKAQMKSKLHTIGNGFPQNRQLDIPQPSQSLSKFTDTTDVAPPPGFGTGANKKIYAYEELKRFDQGRPSRLLFGEPRSSYSLDQLQHLDLGIQSNTSSQAARKPYSLESRMQLDPSHQPFSRPSIW